MPPMQRALSNAETLTKVEFHRRLREWLQTSEEEESQIGPGNAPYILIFDDEKLYLIHSDAKRSAVKEYLSLVEMHGDSIKWTLCWTQKKKFKLVKVGPNTKYVKSLLLYSVEEGTPESDSLELSDNSADDSIPEDISKLDPREIVSQQIKRRRGQRKFRDALRKRYQNICVVTGCKIVGLLEAAHIRTMTGVDDNSPENGLLLRADIHTLFDLNLLSIDPKSLEVRLHSSIKTSEYANHDGQPLLDHNGKPLIEGGTHPCVEALANRFREFRS